MSARIRPDSEILFHRYGPGAILMNYRPPHPHDRFRAKVRNFQIFITLLGLALAVLGFYLVGGGK